jgi:hypothetical protein
MLSSLLFDGLGIQISVRAVCGNVWRLSYTLFVMIVENASKTRTLLGG